MNVMANKEQNEKLTAKQFAVQAASMAKPPYYSEPFEPHTWVLCAMDNYAAQQVEHATAELRKELEVSIRMMSKYKGELDRSNAERLRQAQTLQSYKDRECESESLKAQLSEAQRQRDEAVKILRNVYWEANTDSEGFPQEPKYDDILRNRIEYFFKINGLAILEQSNQPINITKMCNDCNGHGYFIKFGTGEDHACDTCNGTGKIPRLSSGETKPEFKCVHGLPSEATCIDCLDDSHRPPPESLTNKK